MHFRREAKQSFTAPDADDARLLMFAPVHNAKWRVDKLPQKRLVKFRNDAAQVRVVSQCFRPPEDLCNKPVPDFGYPLFCIPMFDSLEISNRRLCEEYGHLWHLVT